MLWVLDAVLRGARLNRARPGATAAACALAALVWPSAVARAQLQATELPTGGLFLGNSAGIEMMSEDIFISPRQIQVRYRFRNASPADVRTVVAFPMPDVTATDAAANPPLPSNDPKNLLAFVVRVNGVPIRPHVVQKAFARGIDRTGDLERLKVPLAPHLRSIGNVLGRLLPVDQDELNKKGLAAVEEHGAGARRQLSPRWTLKTTYFWDQVFPAGKDVVIAHAYKPSVGRTPQTLIGNPKAMQEGWFKEYARKYCIGQELLAAVERARRSARFRGAAPFAEERISYLLASGTNWDRPIGTLRIVIDKGYRASLVSFCADGARKVGATRHEVRQTAAIPDADLHVLILRRWRR